MQQCAGGSGRLRRQPPCQAAAAAACGVTAAECGCSSSGTTLAPLWAHLLHIPLAGAGWSSPSPHWGRRQLGDRRALLSPPRSSANEGLVWDWLGSRSA